MFPLCRLVRNLIYWFSINHFNRIKNYGFLAHLRYVFNFNINRIVVNLQADLTQLPLLLIPEGFEIREMNADNRVDIATWIDIVNQSYPDASEDNSTFFNLLYHHPFLIVEKIFFITKCSVPVGTVTAGRYRKNRSTGGDARIAILPREQGKGLGLLAINYAFHFLRNLGIESGETVITLKRTRSILLHFRCGFVPQYDRSKVIVDVQKRMWPARLIAKRMVSRMYGNYLIQKIMYNQ